MTLSWGDEADGAMPVLLVVPGDEDRHPGTRGGEVREGAVGVGWGVLRVRNRASEKGLSLLTEGRLEAGTTPSFCRMASIVVPFIGAPLSACRVSAWRSTPSRRWDWRNSANDRRTPDG